MINQSNCNLLCLRDRPVLWTGCHRLSPLVRVQVGAIIPWKRKLRLYKVQCCLACDMQMPGPVAGEFEYADHDVPQLVRCRLQWTFHATCLITIIEANSRNFAGKLNLTRISCHFLQCVENLIFLVLFGELFGMVLFHRVHCSG